MTMMVTMMMTVARLCSHLACWKSFAKKKRRFSEKTQTFLRGMQTFFWRMYKY